jgi:hypothetical protein
MRPTSVNWQPNSTTNSPVSLLQYQPHIYFASVRNGTVCPSSYCHDRRMPHKKSKKAPDDMTRASVTKEMARPRMARSARIAEQNLDTTRIPEQPSTILSGIVDKIISSPYPSQPEEAQISLDGADRRSRNLRIENTLADENGDDVRLEKGARVEVTVTAEPKIATIREDR